MSGIFAPRKTAIAAQTAFQQRLVIVKVHDLGDLQQNIRSRLTTVLLAFLGR